MKKILIITMSGYDKPVIYIGEVPFGVNLQGNKLELHYMGWATADHIPATFVFKRGK